MVRAESIIERTIMSRSNWLSVALFTGGLVLGMAGALKLQSGWHSRHEIDHIGLIELGVAAWFVTGLYESAARRAYIFMFAVFASYSFLRVLRGESNCGCFGDDVAVHPAITTFLTATFAITGLLLPSSRDNTTTISVYEGLLRCSSMFYRIALAVVLIAIVVPQVSSHFAFSLSDDFADPRNRSFPDAAFECPPGTSFQHGDWIVVLFHPECNKCHSVLSEYMNKTPPEGVQVALLDVSGGQHRQIRSRPDLIWGRVKNADSIRVRTPLVLRLRDGTVVESSYDRSIGLDHGDNVHG